MVLLIIAAVVAAILLVVVKVISFPLALLGILVVIGFAAWRLDRSRSAGARAPYLDEHRPDFFGRSSASSWEVPTSITQDGRRGTARRQPGRRARRKALRMGPEWLVLLIVIVIAGLVVMTGKRSGGKGESTAGHYDPDAIGSYTLDPATMQYRYDLPTMPRSGGPALPGSGPPHRRRRRRRSQPDGETHR